MTLEIVAIHTHTCINVHVTHGKLVETWWAVTNNNNTMWYYYYMKQFYHTVNLYVLSLAISIKHYVILKSIAQLSLVFWNIGFAAKLKKQPVSSHLISPKQLCNFTSKIRVVILLGW